MDDHQFTKAERWFKKAIEVITMSWTVLGKIFLKVPESFL